MKVNYPLLFMFLLFQALEFLFYGGLAALLGIFIPVNPFYIFVVAVTLDVVSTLVFFRERVAEFTQLVFPED